MNESLVGTSVMVTGGAGFIGSELVRQLVVSGANVTVVDNFVNGKQENLEEISDKITIIDSDIRDLTVVDSLIKDVEIVYHLACLGVRHSIHSPKENNDVNANATLDLLEQARNANIKRFVHVSTSEVYGTARQVPMGEDCPTYPHTIYGAAKLAGECYARAYNDTYKFPTVVIRPFNTYGPRSHHEGDSGEVIPKFFLRILDGKPLVIFGDGSQTRDFLYVSDTARGILLAGIKPNVIGKTINLGAGAEITIKELASRIGRIINKDIEIEYFDSRPADTLRLYADASLAEELLDFRPEVDLDSGLGLLLEWYENLDIAPKELLKDEIEHNWKS